MCVYVYVCVCVCVWCASDDDADIVRLSPLPLLHRMFVQTKPPADVITWLRAVADDQEAHDYSTVRPLCVVCDWVIIVC